MFLLMKIGTYLFSICTFIFLFLEYFILKTGFIANVYSYIIFNFIISIMFLYNFLFFWVIGKSAEHCDRGDFFSTWGRSDVRDNLEKYFPDKKYRDFYDKLMKRTFLPVVIMMGLLILERIVISKM